MVLFTRVIVLTTAAIVICLDKYTEVPSPRDHQASNCNAMGSSAPPRVPSWANLDSPWTHSTAMPAEINRSREPVAKSCASRTQSRTTARYSL